MNVHTYVLGLRVSVKSIDWFWINNSWLQEFVLEVNFKNLQFVHHSSPNFLKNAIKINFCNELVTGNTAVKVNSFSAVWLHYLRICTYVINFPYWGGSFHEIFNLIRQQGQNKQKTYWNCFRFWAENPILLKCWKKFLWRYLVYAYVK